MNCHAGPTTDGFDHRERSDLEPRIAHVLERKQRLRARGAYRARSDAEVTAQLARLLSAHGLTGIDIARLSRMTGGASKEQFAFELRHDGSSDPQRLVLRMDPTQSIVETCRGREAQILAALADTVPVPPVRFVDADGEHLGQPGLVTGFVAGVTKPSDLARQSVSGIGTRFDSWADRLAPQFVSNLARIHTFDWRTADLPYFTPPAPGTRQAALRQVNWWARVWADGVMEAVPVMALAERWLREHAPVCAKPVVVHADYRIGNFMFEEPSGRFTAVLDWEMAHIGDFHEDLAWSVQRLFGTWREDGEFLISGLLPRRQFLDAYTAATGLRIDPDVFRYYEVLNAYKCAAIDLASGVSAAADGGSHQDLLLSWLACAGAVFLSEIVKLIREAG